MNMNIFLNVLNVGMAMHWHVFTSDLISSFRFERYVIFSRAFVTGLPRGIFGAEITWWRKLHNKENQMCTIGQIILGRSDI